MLEEKMIGLKFFKAPDREARFAEYVKRVQLDEQVYTKGKSSLYLLSSYLRLFVCEDRSPWGSVISQYVSVHDMFCV